MTRTDIINKYIAKFGYNKYLEIGTQNAVNFYGVECESKIGVDPEPIVKDKYIIETTSDEFFKHNVDKFDIIFIDGLHHADQVKKDIENSLKVLDKNGVIICHDMMPPNEDAQKVPRIQKQWMGDCWKAFVEVRMERDDLEMYVVDTDFGVGVIRFGKQEKLDIKLSDINWANFEKNKKEWMNVKEIQI